MTEPSRRRVAVVTGAAQGIGLAAAIRLHADGHAVVLTDRNGALAAERASELGPGARSALLDVTDRESANTLIAALETELGGVDVWVNAAGASAPNMPSWELPLEHWNRAIDINLTAVFHTCAAVVPGMRTRGFGRIVNIASIAGKEGNPNSAAYSAAKAGVIAFTKALGKELARDGVIVNAIAPSAVDTAMFAGLSETSKSYMLARIPMGRPGKPSELAALIAWLSSDECSFSTGAVYDFSGGRASY